MKNAFNPKVYCALFLAIFSQNASAEITSQLSCLLNLSSVYGKYVQKFDGDPFPNRLILPGNESSGSVISKDGVVAVPGTRGRQKGIEVYRSDMSYFIPLPDQFFKHEGERSYQLSFSFPNSKNTYCAKISRMSYISMEGWNGTVADWVADALEAAKSSYIGYDANVTGGSCGKLVKLEEYQTPETYHLLRAALLGQLHGIESYLKGLREGFVPKQSYSMTTDKGRQSVPTQVAYQELVSAIQTCAQNESAPWLKSQLSKDASSLRQSGQKVGMVFNATENPDQSAKVQKAR